jgi:hypothetical protein
MNKINLSRRFLLYGFYLTDIDGGYNHNNDNLKETKA